MTFFEKIIEPITRHFSEFIAYQPATSNEALSHLSNSTHSGMMTILSLMLLGSVAELIFAGVKTAFAKIKNKNKEGK